MSATPQTFVLTFRAFCDEDKYPKPLIGFYLALAYLMLPASRWGTLLDYGAQLFAAHHLALDERARQESELGGVPGTQTGVVSAKSAGPLSLTLDTVTTAEKDVGFWNATMYGLRLYRLIRIVGMGGLQLGVPAGAFGGCICGVSRNEATALLNGMFPSFREDTIPPAPEHHGHNASTMNPALI